MPCFSSLFRRPPLSRQGAHARRATRAWSGATNRLASLLIVLPLLAQPALLRAETGSAPYRAETGALLDRLATSGCQFNRNGTWHTGPEAKAHLQKKFDYLEQRGALKSTEQFIDLAATQSSMSGTPYQVRCGNAAPVDSKRWLTAELQAQRAARKGKP